MLLQAIRRVADDLGHVPSRTSYQEAARRLGLPSLPTVANRFGTWTAAVTVAGMTPNTSPGMQARRWTPDVCWRALVNLTADLGEPPTLDQYELLAAGSDDLPSAATVRIRLGLWSDISARLRSADAHPVLGRLGVASDVPAERRDEEILLAYLADDVTDEELARLVRDGLFAWRPAYGEAPEVLACEDR
ncbi:MAG: homing endonuclease associated repeat-containing protein [Solirubrobacteraceae bacterium]